MPRSSSVGLHVTEDKENTVTESNADSIAPSSSKKTASHRKPRKSLVAGEARKDRFASQRKRPGTGREPTNREIGLVGRKTGAAFNTGVDANGFVSLDAVFGKQAAKTPVRRISVAAPGTAGGDRPFDVIMTDGSDAEDAADTHGSAAAARRLTFDNEDVPMSVSPAPSTPLPVTASPAKSTRAAKKSMASSDVPVAPVQPLAPTPVKSPKKKPASPGPAKPAAIVMEPQMDVSMDMDVDADYPDRYDMPPDSPVPEPAKPVTKQTPKGKREVSESKHDEADTALPMEVDQDDDSAQLPAAIKFKPGKQKTKTGSGSGKHHRRQTMALVDAAVKLGVVSANGQEEDSSSTRRGKRERFAPLQYWKNEHLVFERQSEGVGYFLPTVKLSSPIVRAPPTPEPAKKRRRSNNAGPSKKHARKNNNDSASSDEETDSDEKLDGVQEEEDPKAWVYNGRTDAEERIVVCKTAKMYGSYVPLQSEKVPAQKCPLATKIFGEEKSRGFASGIVILPPGGEKAKETAASNESFYVLSSKKHALAATIGTKTFFLSKGDTFFVPVGNDYSLLNRSQKKPVKLHYTLVNDIPAAMQLLGSAKQASSSVHSVSSSVKTVSSTKSTASVASAASSSKQQPAVPSAVKTKPKTPKSASKEPVASPAVTKAVKHKTAK